MGYAKIISGGELGRYTIELDYGASTRTAILAAVDVLIGQITTKLAAVQVKLTAADEKEAAQRVKVAEAQAEYIAQSQSVAPGSPAPSSAAFKFEVGKLTQLQIISAPLRLQKAALDFDMAQTRRRRDYWQAFNPIETREAWCTDLTEDRAAGSYVATMDIPGESALIVLAPGARAWSAGDGVLTARELMSPEQAYFNAAILPGWQKDKPTYRWGTITVLDKEASLCSVALFDAVSSAQRLPINQAGTLTGVPITYMECNADAFEVGDNVVVKFIGQDWDQPVVIGFLDNPKPCIDWPTVELKVTFTAPGTHTDSFRSWMILQTNAACGVIGLLGDMYQSTPATAFLAFDPAGPYFPTPAPSASISSTVPADVNLGPTQIGFGQVPGGGSPGVWQSPEAATYPNNFAIRRVERASSTVTVPESCPTEDDPSPRIVSGPYFNAQPIGSYDDYTNSISASFISHGPARLQDYLPTMPTISVTIDGTTRAYACSGSRGGASSFEWILTFNKP